MCSAPGPPHTSAQVDGIELRQRHMRWLSIALILAVWLGTTYVGWMGYYGSDDLVYASYAFKFNQAPHTIYQFRMPLVLLLRGSFLLFGPTEFAACLPTIVASLALMASVAWFVGWPRKVDWRSQGSMLLAATLNLDLEGRTCPNAAYLAAAFFAAGAALILKGRGKAALGGAPLLALAFLSHEIAFFYVAIFCTCALAIDFRRFRQPVLATVAASALAVAAECAAYGFLLGAPLARYALAGQFSDPRFGEFSAGSLQFNLWPLQVFVFDKRWGVALLALAISGIASWRRLDVPQKVLLSCSLLIWFWFGYGTQAPWAYKPILHSQHYYFPLGFGIAAMLPYTAALACGGAQWLAKAAIGFMVLVNLLVLAGERRISYNVHVSRDLLRYAERHPEQRFLTDAYTFNEMYVVNGFQAPENVVTLKQIEGDNSGPASDTRFGPAGGSRAILYGDLRAFYGETVPHIAAHGSTGSC